jgi:hypothetical protein
MARESALTCLFRRPSLRDREQERLADRRHALSGSSRFSWSLGVSGTGGSHPVNASTSSASVIAVFTDA